MAFPIGAIVGALNLIRGASAASRVIRVGRRVYRMLDSEDPKNNFRPQIDIVKTSRSFNNIIGEMNKIAGSPTKKSIRHMRQGAGDLAGDVAMLYPPFKKGEQASHAKIDSDINKIFKPLENIPFGEIVMSLQFSAAAAYNYDAQNKNIKNAIESKNWNLVFESFRKNGWKPTTETITVVGAPTRTLHHSALSKNGVIRKTFHVSGPKAKAQASIDEYAKSVKQAVGKMVGGWVKCYISLGGRGRSLNASYATIGRGESAVIVNKSQVGVRMSNAYGNYNGYMTNKAAQVKDLANYRMIGIVKGVESDLKHEISMRRLPK